MPISLTSQSFALADSPSMPNHHENAYPGNRRILPDFHSKP